LLINAFNPLVVNNAQLSSHWLWSGDLSRAEPGGGGAAAAAAVLAGAPEGSRPPEGHQEEEACLRPQVSTTSCLPGVNLLFHVLQPSVEVQFTKYSLPFAKLLASNEVLSA